MTADGDHGHHPDDVVTGVEGVLGGSGNDTLNASPWRRARP